MIYFIGNKQFVKIGYTENIKRRVDELAAGSLFPIQVFGIIDGDGPAEKVVHDRFKHLHSHREWFKFDNEIIEYIRQHESQDFTDKKRKKKFFGRLKLLRLQEGHTLKSFSETINVYYTTVDKIERKFEKDKLTIEKLRKYVNDLGYDLIIDFVKKEEGKKGL